MLAVKHKEFGDGYAFCFCERGEKTYRIVGSYEADPLQGKISDASPIGLALIGASEGDTVVATTAKGAMELKVISVTRAKI